MFYFLTDRARDAIRTIRSLGSTGQNRRTVRLRFGQNGASSKTHVFRLVIIEQEDLPISLESSNILCETILDVSDEEGKDLTGKIIQIASQQELNLAENAQDCIQFLTVSNRKLNAMKTAKDYVWNAKRLKCVAGQGKLYVMLPVSIYIIYNYILKLMIV